MFPRRPSSSARARRRRAWHIHHSSSVRSPQMRTATPGCAAVSQRQFCVICTPCLGQTFASSAIRPGYGHVCIVQKGQLFEPANLRSLHGLLQLAHIGGEERTANLQSELSHEAVQAFTSAFKGLCIFASRVARLRQSRRPFMRLQYACKLSGAKMTQKKPPESDPRRRVVASKHHPTCRSRRRVPTFSPFSFASSFEVIRLIARETVAIEHPRASA